MLVINCCSLLYIGDVVCMEADGFLTFIGRRDSKVKLRGMQFELGEVEAALLTCSGDSTAIPVVRDVGTSSPILVGYVTPQSVSTRLLTVICIIINTLVTHLLVVVTFDR